MGNTITGNEDELFDVAIYFHDGRKPEHHVAVSAELARELEALINVKPAISQIDVTQYGGESPEADTVKALGSALRAVHGRMLEAIRSGDEWASEFMAEDWPYLVPESVRVFLGIGED